jgi:hypothetical protein
MIAARREGPRDSHSGIGAKFAFFGRILGASGNIERKREAPLPARKQMRKNSNPYPRGYSIHLPQCATSRYAGPIVASDFCAVLGIR